MSEHTPGPWEAEIYPYPVKSWIVKASDGRIFRGLTASDMTEANARLIVAAPDLLEACEAILRSTKRGSKRTAHDEWIIQRLEEVIAKPV